MIGHLSHSPVLLLLLVVLSLLSLALAAPTGTQAVCPKRRAWPSRVMSTNSSSSSSASSGSGSGSGLSRMDKIKNMYAFAGFVYAVNVRSIALFAVYLGYLRMISSSSPATIALIIRCY